MDQSYDAPLEDLLRTYREDGGINYLEVATTLPSRPAIDESCVDLLGLLFPGFRGDALVHSSDLPDITRSRIETLHARLKPEVARASRCESATDAIEQRAEEVFRLFYRGAGRFA